jgi:ABC-type multidrug transport system fused ATPase/permease subunit
MKPLLLVPTLALFAGAAVVGGLHDPVPKALPDTALGSALVLHVERMALIFGALVVFLVIVMWALRGYLPSRWTATGPEYDVINEDLEETVRAVRRIVGAQQEDIAALKKAVDEVLDALTEPGI